MKSPKEVITMLSRHEAAWHYYFSSSDSSESPPEKMSPQEEVDMAERAEDVRAWLIAKVRESGALPPALRGGDEDKPVHISQIIERCSSRLWKLREQVDAESYQSARRGFESLPEPIRYHPGLHRLRIQIARGANAFNEGRSLVFQSPISGPEDLFEAGWFLIEKSKLELDESTLPEVQATLGLHSVLKDPLHPVPACWLHPDDVWGLYRMIGERDAEPVGRMDSNTVKRWLGE